MRSVGIVPIVIKRDLLLVYLIIFLLWNIQHQIFVVFKDMRTGNNDK